MNSEQYYLNTIANLHAQIAKLVEQNDKLTEKLKEESIKKSDDRH